MKRDRGRVAAAPGRDVGAGAASTSRCIRATPTRVEVCIYDAVGGAESARFELPARTGDVWHGLLAAAPRRQPGTHYAFCVRRTERAGERAALRPRQPHCSILARACCRRRSRCAARSSIRHSTGSGDRPPAIPWRDTVIYELHVKGFTRLHPGVPPGWRGKYLGLTAAPVIEHLKSLGVTAVELLPCQASSSENFLLDRGLTNYWGYNPVAWFAPANEYARRRRGRRVQDHGQGAASGAASRSSSTWCSITPPRATTSAHV